MKMITSVRLLLCSGVKIALGFSGLSHKIIIFKTQMKTEHPVSRKGQGGKKKI